MSRKIKTIRIDIFINIEKAYDSVPRNLLWKVLQEARISIKVIDILKLIYSRSRCQVKIGPHLSKKFYTSKGLLQGCCVSPILIGIKMDI